MEACYEYLACKEMNCKMRGRQDNKRCWETEDTLCNYAGVQLVRKIFSELTHEQQCAKSGCIYYKAAKMTEAQF